MLRLFSIFYIFFIAFSFISSGQNNFITPKNADCIHAIEIKDSIWGPTNPPKGIGNFAELIATDENPFLFEEEHNTVWYYFKIPFDCSLTFDIIPETPNDDYDFILYEYQDTGFCNNLKKYQPIRSCKTRNDISIDGKTGLSFYGVANNFPSGPGPSYCQEIKVHKGEVYYLVLDNVYENGKGHTIHLHYNISVYKETTRNYSLNINVIDASSKDLINAHIEIYEKIQKGSFKVFKEFKGNSSCYLKVSPSSSYNMWIRKEGYLSYTNSFSTSDTQSIYTFNIPLKSILAGDTIVFDNIYFHGNSARIKPESNKVLDIIYYTLLSNPLISISLLGHVNAPLSRYEPNSYMELSTNRAKAVYTYLVKKGISPERMHFEGSANNNMLYPYAWKEEEMKRNRRVEVVIQSTDTM